MEIRVRKASEGIRRAVQKEVDRQRQFYSERDNVIHRIRRQRLLRHEVRFPKAYQNLFGNDNAVKLPIMYRLVQTAVTAVAKGYPTVYVEPISMKDRKAAEEMGKALQLLLQTLDSMYGYQFLYNSYYNLMGDGLMVLKAQPGGWTGFPLMEESEEPEAYLRRVADFVQTKPLPFVARTVDPLLFYPPRGQYGEGLIVETGHRSRAKVFETLGYELREDGRVQPLEIPKGRAYPGLELPPSADAMVEVDEVWDKDGLCAVRMGNTQDVWIFESPVGEHPYVWGYADPTGVLDPANVGMSVAYPLIYLTPWIDTLLGIAMAWSMLAAPTPYTTQSPVPGLPPITDTTVEVFQPGMMYHLPTGKQVGVLEPPPVGSHILGMMNFLIESSDRGGLPSLVSGSNIGSRLPALTFQAAFEAATDRLRPAVQSAEVALAGFLRKICRIIARYDLPVRVDGWKYYAEDNTRRERASARITPEEAAKGRLITVSLAVDSTQDTIAKGVHAMQMMDAMLWDWEKAARYSGVRNPEETKEKIAGDIAWKQLLPQLAAMVTDPQFDQYKQYLQEQQAQAQAGAAGPAQMGEAGAAGPAPAGAAGPAPMSSGGVVRHSFHRGGRPAGMPTERPRGRRLGKGALYGRQ